MDVMDLDAAERFWNDFRARTHALGHDHVVMFELHTDIFCQAFAETLAAHDHALAARVEALEKTLRVLIEDGEALVADMKYWREVSHSWDAFNAHIEEFRLALSVADAVLEPATPTRGAGAEGG